MFFFNRKSSSHSDFSAVGIDVHSHLVPGVDDGSTDVENSLDMISGLHELGYHTIIATPHTLQDYHPNTKETLKNGFDLIYDKVAPEIVLKLSSEYYLDEQFFDQMNANALLPFPGNRILVEFSQITPPHNLEEMFFEIMLKGYQIILAHPERYLFLHSNFNTYKRIKEIGVEFQINAMSLTSHYGKGINQIAEKLIDKDMIDFIGTDIHHLGHLEVLKRVPAKKHFARLVDSGLLKNQTLLQL